MNNINPDESHEAYHAAANAGQQEYAARTKADGLRGDTTYFRCMVSPGDRVALTRIGPPGGQSAHIVLGMAIHGEVVGTVMLTPAEARKMAAALLDNIEDCDPAKPLVAMRDPYEALNIKPVEGDL